MDPQDYYDSQGNLIPAGKSGTSFLSQWAGRLSKNLPSDFESDAPKNLASYGGGLASGVTKYGGGGALSGAGSSVFSQDLAKALAKGDYGSMGSTMGQGAIKGAAGQAVMSGLSEAVPFIGSLASKVSPYATPIAVGSSLFQQGKSGSLVDVLANKVAGISPTPPDRDLGRMAGDAIYQGAKQGYNWLGSHLPFGLPTWR